MNPLYLCYVNLNAEAALRFWQMVNLTRAARGCGVDITEGMSALAWSIVKTRRTARMILRCLI